MNLTGLRYFAEVAEQGSFRKASLRLRIAQPAVSRQVKLLEEELGVELFVRHGRGVLLTESGETLLRGARSMLSLSEQIRADIGAISQTPTGHIRLGFQPSAGRLLAGRCLAEFCRVHPNVTFEVFDGLSQVVGERILNGQLDMGIYNPGAANPYLIATPLYEKPIWAIAHPDRPLGPDTHLTVAALAAYPLIAAASVFRQVLRAGPEGAFKLAIELNGFSISSDLLARNAGVLLCPPEMFCNELDAGVFHGRPVSGLSTLASIVRRSDVPPSRAMIEFERHVIELSQPNLISGDIMSISSIS
ncbi:LysR family transcriptional regulator [Chelatococcus asaccharovorans]|uniref:LysR family nitrogen assimilation transcriptional regulator n=1 Tax=Chelatococcus asaccharovorans TaxID=28210 RepID=A0A2V3U1Q7_9HYPH|nr:LysR family transcriptional regulator [Chelatococcus asaccharovorans]MBS7708162.1 LysR family transcriptional regulator [Chelatococcus asaccharovorans]PXW50703.1 LysR family nitrogen assimilation transcriptional regulator [Chelatococcus asaccharovorans]